MGWTGFLFKSKIKYHETTRNLETTCDNHFYRVTSEIGGSWVVWGANHMEKNVCLGHGVSRQGGGDRRTSSSLTTSFAPLVQYQSPSNFCTIRTAIQTSYAFIQYSQMVLQKKQCRGNHVLLQDIPNRCSPLVVYHS